MASAQSQSLVALVGLALLFGRGAFALASKFFPGKRALWFAAAVMALASIPLGTLSLAGYLRGITGDLSVSTLVVLAVGFFGGVESKERSALSLLVVGGAVFLYPMALGVSSFDPYRLGFAPSVVLLAALAVISVLAWLRQFHFVLACVLLSVSAHTLDIMESTNLWDYLFDPWLVAVSIYDLRRLRRKS